MLETILVVDDDASSRQTMAMILDGAGYRVMEATSYSEAMKLALQESPSVVLADVELLDGQGAMLLRRFRAKLEGVPVVMVTSHATVEEAVEALNQGAAAFIVKPLNLDSVLATVRQLLEQRRLLRENQRLMREVQQELAQRRRVEVERDLMVKAVEAAGEGLVVTDAEGKVLYANPAFEKITGQARRAVIDRPLEPLGGERQAEVEQVLRTGSAWAGDFESQRDDGSEYREECTITAVTNQDGEVTNFVHVRRDVTERQKLESIAQAVNLMDNIGYVFAGIRHELGNPINATKMTLKMLRSRVEDYDRDAMMRYLERALDELGRVSFLLHSLKSFNLYESLEVQPMDLEPFLEQFSVLVSRDCERRGVSFVIRQVPKDLTISTDPRAFQQVLLNVLTNALDALEGVDGARVELGARRHGGDVIVTVEDNGVGMSPEILENLYRPFVTTKKQGTGLGLVIAKKMMSQMDGSIEISSTEGSGTVVNLRLMEVQRGE